MPSAHGPIFFNRRQNIRPTLRFFMGGSFGAHGPIVVTMTGGVLLLDYVTAIFYRTKVSAHEPIICHRQIVGWKDHIFIGANVTAHDFTPIFMFAIQNRSVCAKNHTLHSGDITEVICTII